MPDPAEKRLPAPEIVFALIVAGVFITGWPP